MTTQVAVKNITEEQMAKRAKLKGIVSNFGPLFGFVGIVLLFSVLTGGKIVQPKNLSLMLSQVFVLMTCCCGVFLIMTVGGLDFSQGSVLGLSSIIFCWVSMYSIPLAIIASVASGAVMGAFNGFFHVRFKIASFIVTMCSQSLGVFASTLLRQVLFPQATMCLPLTRLGSSLC